MELMIDEAFTLVSEVYRQAIREATGSNPKLAQEAREWLAIVAPDWEELKRGCDNSVAQWHGKSGTANHTTTISAVKVAG